MVDVVARLKVKGKTFEVIVDCDKALEFKKQGKGGVRDFLLVNTIFKDYKKGFKASMEELEECFNTDSAEEISKRILKDGEILLPQEYREKERDAKLKQVADFLARNCTDPRTNAPYTSDRILSLMKEARVNIDNRSVNEQAIETIKKIQSIVPIKISTKKIKIKIPASFAVKSYSLLKNFSKEREEWLADGSFLCIIDLPAGMQLEFYDKLNSFTHGSAITEEIKQEA